MKIGVRNYIWSESTEYKMHVCSRYFMSAGQSAASEHVFLYFYYYTLPLMYNMIDLCKII